MADEVKFQTGMGQPVVAYNLQPNNRKAVVEANVYSHEEPVTAKLASWGNYYGSKNIKPVDKGQGKFLQSWSAMRPVNHTRHRLYGEKQHLPDLHQKCSLLLITCLQADIKHFMLI